ncbi:MAG: hypothetical protein HQL67_09455 [Magnetococcales bacterium]|nr:hypothetical protein [Magnetococcales bacterium]
MKKLLSIATLLTASIGFSALANAECAVNYTRTACAGQEAVSYKKCDGNQSCSKVKEASSEFACWQAALKSCNNDRLDITKYKQITATYNGQPLTGGFDDMGNPSATGSNFCWSGRPDLNQCQ